MWLTKQKHKTSFIIMYSTQHSTFSKYILLYTNEAKTKILILFILCAGELLPYYAVTNRTLILKH